MEEMRRPVAEFRCLSCGYSAYYMSVRLIGDVEFRGCPKCGGDMKIVSSGEMPPSTAEVESLVSRSFTVTDFDLTKDHMQFEVESADTGASFTKLSRELGRKGYLAALRRRGEVLVLVVLKSPRLGKENALINFALILLTICTTFVAGYFWLAFGKVDAVIYSAALLVILGIHEIGHKIAAWRNGMAATLPYFIPAPTVLGTFGAFIKVKSPPPTRAALVEMGALGPLFGFAFALPIAAVGLAFSKPTGGEFAIATPLLFILMSYPILGSWPTVQRLHPLAFAGLVGMFLTWMNLIPAGQLDGGHMARGMLERERHYSLTRMLGFILIFLGLVWAPLLFWGILILFLFKGQHPGALDDVSRLTRRQRFLAWGTFAVFLLCLPIPLL